MKNQERCFLILDYETRSEVDLKKAGAFEYAVSPSTEILCVAWRTGTFETLREAPILGWASWIKPHHKNHLPKLLSLLLDPDVTLIAHNAFFEQVITTHVLSRLEPRLREIPVHRWACTASFASALALPRSLEGACNALNLSVKKDMEGNKLIQKYCKPRRETKNNKNKWHDDYEDLKRLLIYCRNDILAETELFLSIPSLIPLEREVWKLDQTINHRGFNVDRELVHDVLDMVETETKVLTEETAVITKGELSSTNQRAAMLRWLESQGVKLSDLTAGSVQDAIATGLASGDAKRLLQIRAAVSKTSTAKYEAFELRSRFDGRARDNLMYCGASTGRWSGRGVQVQNLPRGSIKNTDQASEILKTGDLEFVRLCYGEPMDVFSSCIRSCITASPGKELFCADYAAIEARVLFWVADHSEGLRAYKEGKDLYREMAASIFSKKVEDVTLDERRLGKSTILGCGYQMGAPRFLENCLQQGVEVDEELAKLAVSTYREAHEPVKLLWNKLEKAAIKATKESIKISIKHTKWSKKNKFLWCELPSGRAIAFYGPEVRAENPRFASESETADKVDKLYHYSSNPVSKKWECTATYGGKLTENVIQAIARDLMADAMLRIEAAGYEIIMTVHDELVAERTIGEGSVEEFENLMATTPKWAAGCPIKVEGWKGPRYKK